MKKLKKDVSKKPADEKALTGVLDGAELTDETVEKVSGGKDVDRTGLAKACAHV